MAPGAPLDRLNALPADGARAELARCCGAVRWVERVLGERPFRSEGDLLDRADRAFADLGRADWLEAFAHHPKIGDLEGLRKRFASTRAWAAGEQAGASGAPEAVLAALAEGNRAYEVRFGFIFIVCATGKSAEEMLSLLGRRIDNDPEAELGLAAGEQKKITRIRLEKLLGHEP